MTFWDEYMFWSLNCQNCSNQKCKYIADESKVAKNQVQLFDTHATVIFNSYKKDMKVK